MTAYTKVALAGATGNLGPSVLDALVSAGFEVTVLSRSDSVPNLPSGVKVSKVDYTSQDSLVAALKGIDALVCNLPTHDQQPSLIDAAIAAGVKRYLPSEFGSNVPGNAKTAALPVFKGKLLTEQYLQGKEDVISWTAVITSAFLDWGLKVGFIGSLKGPLKIWDGGDVTFSATLLSDVGKAVAGVLKHPEETKNRAVYVQSTATTQNKLLQLGKQANPDLNPEIENIDVRQFEKDAYAAIQAGGPGIGGGMISLIQVSLFDPSFGGNFSGKNDNELLGIKELSDKELQDVVAQYV